MDLLWFHNDVIIGTFPQPSLPHTSERSKWPLLWERRCLNVSSNFETYLLLNEMNSFSETNRILYKISNEMRDRDLQNIKHLCHGRIPLGDLEKSKSPSALFQIMLQRRMISPGNLSHLERLLTQIELERFKRMVTTPRWKQRAPCLAIQSTRVIELSWWNLVMN